VHNVPALHTSTQKKRNWQDNSGDRVPTVRTQEIPGVLYNILRLC
jgi:hypothetical protein